MTDDKDKLVKLSVNLLPVNAQAIYRMKEVSGDTATDCVNRAIGMYSYLLEHVLLPGHTLYVRKKGTRKLAELKVEWLNPDYGDVDR